MGRPRRTTLSKEAGAKDCETGACQLFEQTNEGTDHGCCSPVGVDCCHCVTAVDADVLLCNNAAECEMAVRLACCGNQREVERQFLDFMLCLGFATH